MPSKKSAFSVGEDNPPTTETRLEHPVLALRYSMNPSCCRASHAASATIRYCASDDAWTMVSAYPRPSHHARSISIQYLDSTGFIVLGKSVLGRLHHGYS